MTTEPLVEPVDVLVLLLRRWRTLCVFALLGVAAGVAYACLATPWYAASITVIPSQRSPEGGGPGAALPYGLDALAIDAQRIRSVLGSSSVTAAVIDRFARDAHSTATERERLRDTLSERCHADVDKDPGLVTLTCEDPSPALAARWAELLGEEGNRVFGNISVSSARAERKFLEAQVEKTRSDLEQASRKLREFQRTYKIIDLPEQSKAVISAMAAIEGEIVSKQLQLSYLAGFSSDTESNVVQLRHQLRVMQAKLRQIETAGATRTSDFFPAATSVPELRFQLDELVREQKLQEALFFAMNQRYETAKIDEARDTPTFQILDHAMVPRQPFRPRRPRTVELAGVVGVGFAGAWILVPVWWRRRTQRTTL